MALPPKRPVAFSEPAARRIGAAVRRVELTPRRYGQRPSRADNWTYSVVRAKATTAISAGTFGSPSHDGRAQLYHDGEASGDPVVVYNQFGGGSIAVDAALLLAWIGGKWFVLAADC